MTLKEYKQFDEIEWKALPPIFPEPTLRWPDCPLDDRLYKRVPMLLDTRGRIIGVATSWLLHLTVSKAKPLTLEKYAYAIRMYYAFLGDTPLAQSSSALLRRWRDSLESSHEGTTINQSIDTVVAFLLWAQEFGHLSGVIGETPPGGQAFPVRLIIGKGRNKRLVCDVRADTKNPTRLPVPSTDDMDRLYARLTGPNEATSERNCLMADLAVQAGLRREEFASLPVAAVPSRGDINKHRLENKVHRLSVTGKGGKTRIVPVLPELMSKLRDHIEGLRKELLGQTTRPSKWLFVSRKGGGRLTGSYISKLFTKAFGDSKQSKLTVHRLRARFASLLVLTLARREMKKRGLRDIREDFVLRQAAELLGHEDIETLRHYVDLSIRMLEVEADGKTPSADEPGVDGEVLSAIAQQNRRSGEIPKPKSRLTRNSKKKR
jgi:site-specific recombinase XerD